MAKIEMSIEKYAESVGVTRGTIYRWAKAREAGKKSKLPKGVSVKMVAGHYVIVVKS